MRSFLLVLTIMVIVCGCKNQPPVNHSVTAGTVYEASDVDTAPEPEGGFENLYKVWNSKVKYTLEAVEKGIEGRVFVRFVVDEQGQMSNFKIEQGLGYGLDDAALTGLEKTNLKWAAAEKEGKKVSVNMIMPFVFKLNQLKW